MNHRPDRAAILLALLLAACGGSETAGAAHPSPSDEPAPAASSVSPPSDGSVEQCTVSVACQSALAAEQVFDATGSGPSRIAACRAAGDAVREIHPCPLASVDGMAVGWLRTAVSDPPPAGTLEREVACEVEIARAASEETMGHGAGTTDEAAVAAAIQAACIAIGETDCTLAGGFLSGVRNRRTSSRFAEGVMTSSTEVDVALWRVTLHPGRGTSLSSGAEACASAYLAACGAEGCGERDRLVSVDGITVTP